MITFGRIVILLSVTLVSVSFAQKPEASEDKQVKKTPEEGQKRKTAKPSGPEPGTPVDEKMFGAMRWRQVGPFRGGRVLAVTGVPGEPSVFYFGAASGGIWKSMDAGGNWAPLFDKQPIASIGAIAVAQSDHNVI